MRTLGLSFLLLATACGGAVSTVPCLGPVEDESVPEVPLKRIEYLITLAIRMIAPVTEEDEASLCQTFEVVPVVIHAGLSWELNGTTVDGLYYHKLGYLEGLELGRGMSALAHELLHKVDDSAGVKRVPEHSGWDLNGYYRIDRAFTLATSESPPPTNSP